MIHSIDLHDVGAVIGLFQKAARALRESPWRRHCIEVIPGKGRLIATGDLHDSATNLEKILQVAKLRRSKDHHVVLHELIHGDNLINGMDYSYKMLAKTAELVLEYPGQVHPIMANHEMAQMLGKSVSKGAGDNVKLFNAALEFEYGTRWTEVSDGIGGFIAAMPLGLKSESGLLCTHSLPSAIAMKRFDYNIFDRDLQQWDFIAGGPAYELVWGREYTAHSVDALSLRWGVKLFICGHQHVDTGIEVRCGKVVVLNSDHDRATILPLDLAQLPTPEEVVLYATPLNAIGATV